jgi:hypothetical protein
MEGMMSAEESVVPAEPVRPKRRRPWKWLLAIVAVSGLAVLSWAVYHQVTLARRLSEAATARIRVMASRPTLLGEPRVLSEVEVARYRETERAMVRSRKILQRALEVADVSSSISLQGREDQLAWLEAGLESRFDGEILTLTFAGGSRRDNATIL